MFPVISEVCTAPILRVKESIFYPEDGDSTFLQNIRKQPPDLMVSHPKLK
jgi:hypothetical protein